MSSKVTNYASNILYRYRSAHPHELNSGLIWYRQAHSLARLLGSVAQIPVEDAAGVLAALSPLNDWLSNVSDAFCLARDRDYRARTPTPNKLKAIQILDGEPADGVLRGRKVRSFWKGIADPFRATEIAVDRHLYRAAIDREIKARDAAPSPKEYDEIERAFSEIGERVEETAVGVASTVWIVMRRLTRPGQKSLEF